MHPSYSISYKKIRAGVFIDYNRLLFNLLVIFKCVILLISNMFIKFVFRL